jgi:hypothetical protein
MPVAVVDLHRVAELVEPAASAAEEQDPQQLHQITEKVAQSIPEAAEEQADMEDLE